MKVAAAAREKCWHGPTLWKNFEYWCFASSMSELPVPRPDTHLGARGHAPYTEKFDYFSSGAPLWSKANALFP